MLGRYIQYIPQNMYAVLLLFVLFRLHNLFLWIHEIYVPISAMVASQTLGPPYCPGVRAVTLKYVGKAIRYQTATKHNKAPW